MRRWTCDLVERIAGACAPPIAMAPIFTEAGNGRCSPRDRRAAWVRGVDGWARGGDNHSSGSNATRCCAWWKSARTVMVSLSAFTR